MSSRQRARLAAIRREQHTLQNSDTERSGEETPSASENVSAQRAFKLLSNDSDSDTDDSGSAGAVSVKAAVAALPKNSSKKKKKKGRTAALKDTDVDIAAALEEIEALQKEEGLPKKDQSGPSLSDILSIDPRNLDVDSLIRQRFAGAAADTGVERGGGRRGAGVRQGNAKHHVHRLGGASRFIFGMPKDEWLKPPSYIGGGVGMDASASSEDMGSGDRLLGSRLKGCRMYQFVWADEYVKINEEFTLIQQSGDANRLVTFLSRYHYHQEGLLQLAMVFARTGQMDRASDLVRRCLFCIQCAEAEGFRPCTGTVLLNPAFYENKIYFAAVFRHMQIVGMLGCPSVAANIAKLLLSLNPFGDTAHVLLCLDYFLLSAGEAEEFEKIYDNAACIIVGVDTSEAKEKTRVAPGLSSYLDLSDLPNWCFSAALNAFLRFKKCGVYLRYKSSASDDPEAYRYEQLADSRLRLALQKYPFFLHSILPLNAITPGGSGGSVVGTASSVILPGQWRDLLGNSFFHPLPASRKFEVFAHLGDIYRARSSVLWANKKGASGGGSDFVDVEKWIYDISISISQQSDSVEV